MMSAVPASSAVATPAAFTVAMAGALLAQVKVMPGITWPFSSRACAMYCCVAPMSKEAVAGITVTDATSAGGGGGPLSLQAPNVFEPLVAIQLFV